MPGVGEDAGAWMSYAAAKAVSKEREQFGKGSIGRPECAAETGDMSSIPATSFQRSLSAYRGRLRQRS